MGVCDISRIARSAFLYGLFGASGLYFGACSEQHFSDAADAPKLDTTADRRAADASDVSSVIDGSRAVPDPPETVDAGGTSPMGVAPAPMLDAAGSAGMSGLDGTDDAGSSVPRQQPDGKCLKRGDGSYAEPGPYRVILDEVDLGQVDPSQQTGKFTIYSPSPLEADCPHPIVAWGNGTAVSDADAVYGFLNHNAASWGIVVIASNDGNVGSGKFHEAGVQYLLKANLDPKHKFYGRLSTRVGLSGHDSGGFGASLAASHPNVEAIVTEGANIRANPTLPVLILTGTDDLFSNAMSHIASATAPIFVATWQGGTGTGTATMVGYLGRDSSAGNAEASRRGSLQFQRLYTAWFRCFLAGDDDACKLFTGETPNDCGICKDPGWNALVSKNL